MDRCFCCGCVRRKFVHSATSCGAAQKWLQYLTQKQRQRAVKFRWLGLRRSAQDGRWQLPRHGSGRPSAHNLAAYIRITTMTFGKRLSETQRAKPPKHASNDIPARYWVPVLGAVAIAIGLVVVSRVVTNMPPDAPVAVVTEPPNK